MKKIALFFIYALSLLSLIGCDFNAPLRNKMLNYYNQDENYSQLIGVVKAMEYFEESERLFIEIDFSTENDFPENAVTGYGEFVLIGGLVDESDLCIDDTITFLSAPMYFYNGHQLPIVYLEKEGEILLPFDEGKEEYLNWIKQELR